MYAHNTHILNNTHRHNIYILAHMHVKFCPCPVEMTFSFKALNHIKLMSW